MSENIYAKNISALAKVDPSLTALLFSHATNEKFSVYQGKDLLDINIINNESHQYMYDNPLKDLEALAQEFETQYSRYPVLFFYGIGNGIFYKLLSGNPTHKHFIIIEPEVELIYIALNFIDIAEDIKNERIIIKLSSQMTFGEATKIVYKGDIKPYVKLYNLNVHSNFYETYQDDMNNINQLLIRSLKQMVLNHGNDTKDALIGIEQHIANLPKMIAGHQVQDLFKQRVAKHAVVISTGPSLAKQLPLLKQYAPYLTLICIDASLPILQKHNIVPDIVVSMERVELTSKFFEDLSPEVREKTYFLVSSLTHAKSIKNLENTKLILAMRPLSYMRYFDMPEYGYVGSGMSAANLGYQAAYLMHHENIILIGQDLAYSEDGRSHAKGHIFTENELTPKDDDLLVTKYGGEGVIKTTLVWSMFRNFFERDIEFTTQKSIMTFNCTEGGAKIHGAIERSFQDTLKDIIDTDTLKSNIDFEPTKAEEVPKKLKHAHEKTQSIVDYGLEFKEEIETLFLDIANQIEEIEELNKSDELQKIEYANLLELSDRIDVIKEKVESLEFSKMYIDTVQSYIFHQELDLAKIVVKNAETEEEKKTKLVEWVIAHKYWLFSLAGGIEAELTAVTRGRSNLIVACHDTKLL